MKKLLKAYGFNSDMQYFERVVFLITNNDEKASKQMFMDMTTYHRKKFVVSIVTNWITSLTPEQKSFFINLI